MVFAPTKVPEDVRTWQLFKKKAVRESDVFANSSPSATKKPWGPHWQAARAAFGLASSTTMAHSAAMCLECLQACRVSTVWLASPEWLERPSGHCCRLCFTLMTPGWRGVHAYPRAKTLWVLDSMDLANGQYAKRAIWLQYLPFLPLRSGPAARGQVVRGFLERKAFQEPSSYRRLSVTEPPHSASSCRRCVHLSDR